MSVSRRDFIHKSIAAGSLFPLFSLSHKKNTIDLKSLNKDDVFGTVEAVKTVSDLFIPVSGEILEFNESLNDNPELINESPYDEGWIIKMKVEDSDQLIELLDSKSYSEITG